MDNLSLSQITGVQNPLSNIIIKSRKLAEHYSMFESPEQVKYYCQFPQIQTAFNELEGNISNLIKDIANFVGFECNSKNNIKITTTAEIVDQYIDNIQIKIKKFQEEEQKIRIKQNHPDKNPQETKTQKHWNLLHPNRITQLAPFKFDSINYQEHITLSNDIKSTNLVYVDTQAKFNETLLKLSVQSQIAVDLEHSDRSYSGFTCLIQISTRTEDYIIDVFPLWRVINQLNIVFNNPNILKILHGAYMDIKWLHRDFDIKVSNLFDTFHAAQHLSLQQCSYAYLLKHYCGVQTNKKFQMADWRQRPLPEEMLLYARIDTHYLLEIYDKMKSQIIKKAIQNKLDPKQGLNNVFSHSKTVSENRYVETDFKQTKGYQEMMGRQRASYPQKRCQILQKLFQIRDKLARQEDENVQKFIPVKYLFELADKKQFDIIELNKTFRKNPELKVYIQRICQWMNEYLKTLTEDNSKSKVIVVPEAQIEQSTQKKRIYKPIQQQNEYQEMYFNLSIDAKCTLKEYSSHSLQLVGGKSILSFECPLNYQLSKFKAAGEQKN